MKGELKVDLFFFVNKRNGTLKYIAMSGESGLLKAKYASFDESHQYEVSYWEVFSQEDFDEIASLQYDVYLYDTNREAEEDTDFVVPLDWETELVQRWVKGEVPTLAEVEDVSFLLLVPDDFPIEGYQDGQLGSLPRGPRRIVSPNRPSIPHTLRSADLPDEEADAREIKVKNQKLPTIVDIAFEIGLSKDDRDNYVRELAAQGWTQTAIGVSANLTRERIRQILDIDAFQKSGIVVPLPPVKPEKEAPKYREPDPEDLARLLELQPFAQKVRSNSSNYREEAEEYSKLLAKVHLEDGVTLYRLALRLGVTHGALRFRLVRYGYLQTTGKSKAFKPIQIENRADT